MKVRYTVGKGEYRRMTSAELREAFLVDLFEDGALNLLYCEVERAIIGAAVPTDTPLALEADRELAADFFCERREAGVLNIGGHGIVSVDGTDYVVEHLDVLYIGRGSKEVWFASEDAGQPARFHLVSYPAHTAYPTALARNADANKIELGTAEDSNRRTINQYIHENGIRSCQLTMGFTVLEPGSVWNTMPCHTHERRTEIYMYFGLDEESTVFHFMGPGDETRHMAVSNEQAVLSPMWSIHSGCGTRAYAFCWAMGGENQRFDDMDSIAIEELR
ncbi:5-dehydro-4-deoxy-D-glucuronate isomerase [Kiritimatiella glycovorans]|uniref:4-deoxy-L-threo-5-hexosulose-uronate ketol-isomerase n=1 Tax=Kiritimatiella glycovorans TaxID=1307763 RepID=A0A0G3EGP2_9BACT|nr:5-dehydro-4-deoxy-D-glucuronate isomerase [Kiritimatiella glycovorans]AKJ65646.1 4-deoxy-L-threo-5-hexosulose-uronate ketol-isomerase [Kiritimatiella glycovorans]